MNKIHLPETTIIHKYQTLKMTMDEIANEYGVSRPTIGKILKKHNIPQNAPGIFFSDKEKIDIVDQYKNKKISITKIAKNYNTCWEVIEKLLTNMEVHLKRRTVLTNKEEQEIIYKYTIDNIGQGQLAIIYGVHQSKIARILARNNITKNFDTRIKNKYNASFFTTESNEKYYFFGFSLGDGCIQVKGGKRLAYSLSLKDTDDCIIKMICEWIGASETIIKYYYQKKGNSVRLNLGGEIWQKDWSKLGLVPHKTYNPAQLDIPSKYIRPFIIGLIDADGCVSFKKGNHTIQLVGHPYNMDWVINQLRLLGFDGNINTQIVKKKWKRIRIQRKADVIKLAQLLEINTYCDIWLSRKWINLYQYIYIDRNHEKDHRRTNSKLTKEQVIAMRKEYANGNTTYTKLAKKYNSTNVRAIIKRLVYTDI